MIATAPIRSLANQHQAEESLFQQDHRGLVLGLGKDQPRVLLFFKNKKKKTASLVIKDFNFSSLGDEGQMVTDFSISINLSEVSEKFGTNYRLRCGTRAAGSRRGEKTGSGGGKRATYHGFL